MIALNSRSQDVLAMGHEAWQMIGRTPGYIVAVRPLRGGAITDFEITQRMIRLLFQRAGVSRLYRARVLICVPSAITHVEQRAVLEAARRAGAAATYLIEQPMAAAIGAGLPIHEPMGNMVVDVGGGTTEVAVISLGGVVALEAVRVGSFDIDAAIQAYVRREYGIAIGERTSEEIKLAIGSAFPTPDEYKAEVRGRDLMSGLPKTIILAPEEVRGAIEEQVRAICDAVVAALAQTPPELAQDLILHGIHLVGGGGMLRGLDLRIAKETVAAGAPRRRAARVRRARRRPLPRVLRPPEGHVHGPPPHLNSGSGVAINRCGRLPTPNVREPGQVGQVLGGLADLPVGVGEGGGERGVDLGAVERGEGEDGPAPDRGPVPAGGEDRGQPAGVADRAERGDRRLAHERVGVRRRASAPAPGRRGPGCGRSRRPRRAPTPRSRPPAGRGRRGG